MQRGDVVEDPEAAPHRRDGEVLLDDLDVGDRGQGKVLLEGGPARTVVERDEHAPLGPEVEQSLAVRVLANHPHRVVVRHPVRPVGDAGPGLAVVVRPVGVRGGVAELVAQDRRVRLGRVVGRNLDVLHPAVGAELGRSDLFPGPAAVAGHVDGSVVRARPDDSLLVGRFLDVVEHREVLLAGHVEGDRVAGDHLRFRGEGGEIGRNGPPGASPVFGDVDVLRGVEDPVGVVRRDVDRDRPLEAVLEVLGVMPVDVPEADVVLLLLSGPHVVEAETALAVRVDHVRISGLRDRRTGLAATDRLPVGGVAAGAGVGRIARHRDRGVVLLAGIEPVGEGVAHVHLVELGGGLVFLGGPGFAAVDRHVRAAVVRLDLDVRVVGVDPEVVVVAVGRELPLPGHAAVGGLEVALGQAPQRVRIGRVGVEVVVVEGAVPDRLEVAHLPPAVPLVIRAEHPAFVGRRLDEHVDPGGIGRRDREVRFAAESLREPVLEFFPGVAAVPRALHAAFHAARADGPGLPLDLPRGGVDGVRVAGLELEVHRPGLLGHEEHELPIRPAVLGAVDPALGVRREGIPDLRHPGGIGIFRMDEDGAGAAGVLEAEAPPGLAGVVGPVDPLPDDDVAAQAVGAGGHIDDVRIAVRHRDGADGGALEGAVRDRDPVVAVVRGLPDAAPGGAHVEGPGMGAVARHRGDPAAPRGADHAVLHGGQQVGVGLGRGGRRDQRREGQEEERRESPAHRTSPEAQDRNRIRSQSPRS